MSQKFIKENINVEAITRSIAHTSQANDSLFSCSINCHRSQGAQVASRDVEETEVLSHVETLFDTQLCSKMFVLQADEQPAEEASSADTHATTYFIDSNIGEVVMAADSRNSVAVVDSTDDLSLGEFLARPTTIDTFTWAVADPLGLYRTIQPWKLLLNTASVKRKLENFAFLRAKLHIKVLLNATPFQYGAMRVCYQPMDGNLTRKFRASATSNLVPLSQLPGFYIYPTLNAGGEMELPFMYSRNWLDLTSNSNVVDFGALFYTIFANLDVAIAGGPTTVTVRTLAWLSDVELMGSTGKLTLQSEDEYGNGPVSKPATAISNFAGHLVNVPIIGRFARATQIGASAVSSIASMFGFTNVPNIDNVSPYHPMSAPQLATAEISVPYQKLALDPKTELSIDPTPFGVMGHDEMALSYLKKKESYFGTCTWSTAAAEDTLLLSVRVTPDLKISEDIVGLASAVVGKRTNMVPLAHIGAMFENWRGSLKFRFKIIGTKYHKGRIKISYDPIFDISTTNVDTNLVYTHILDLGETDEVTITVPYHQELGWFRTDTNASSNNWSTSALSSRFPSDNGTISVRIYNTLEAPTSSSIRILAFVSAGDDFEFANPSGGVTSTGTAVLPSLFALQSEVHFGAPVVPEPNRYGMNFGESIHSLRKLLHRMVVMDTVPLPIGTASAYNLYRKGLCRMPYVPGFNALAAWPTAASGVITAGPKNYAFNTMHPMPWVTSMYVGFRGSTNFCVTTNSPKIVPNDIRFIRVTDTSGITAANRVVVRQTSISGSASFNVKTANLDVINFNRNGLAGMAMTSAGLNPTGMFNLPDYNNHNFSLANPLNYVEGASFDGTDRQGVLVCVTTANTTATEELGYTTLITSAGAGPDFTCIFFCCTPTVDWIVGDPAPIP
jgi:hypothetical protein